MGLELILILLWNARREQGYKILTWTQITLVSVKMLIIVIVFLRWGIPRAHFLYSALLQVRLAQFPGTCLSVSKGYPKGSTAWWATNVVICTFLLIFNQGSHEETRTPTLLLCILCSNIPYLMLRWYRNLSCIRYLFVVGTYCTKKEGLTIGCHCGIPIVVVCNIINFCLCQPIDSFRQRTDCHWGRNCRTQSKPHHAR